jgi:glycosyltransferase involved in cell wall biosynthesis
MVTQRKRHAMAVRAANDFYNQTVRELDLTELVVVMDAPSPRLFSGPNFPVIAQDPAGSLGRWRQQGVEAARGDLVAIWDDDDRSAPDRLRRQLLAMGDADACVLSRVTLECGACGWSGPSHERRWECSMLARRAALPPYQDITRGEDTRVLLDLEAAGGRVVTLDDPGLYLKRWHGGNTWDVQHNAHLFAAAGHSCAALATA